MQQVGVTESSDLQAGKDALRRLALVLAEYNGEIPMLAELPEPALTRTLELLGENHDQVISLLDGSIYLHTEARRLQLERSTV